AHLTRCYRYETFCQDAFVELLDDVIEDLGDLGVAQLLPRLHEALVRDVARRYRSAQAEQDHVHEIAAALRHQQILADLVSKRGIEHRHAVATREVTHSALGEVDAVSVRVRDSRKRHHQHRNYQFPQWSPREPLRARR